MKFSIVMPTYRPNKAKIEEAIESARRQSEDYELVIVENGSGNTLLDTVTKLSDPHIRYFCLEESNVSKARNYAIQRSTGDIICFLDDDDVLDKNALSFYRQALEETGADVLFSGIGDYNRREELTFKCHKADAAERDAIILGIFNQKKNTSGIYGITGECAVRKDFLSAQGIAYREDESFEEDQTFNVTLLAKADNLAILDVPVYLYRKSRREKKKDIGNSIFERFYQHLKIALSENRAVSKQEMNAYVLKTYMKYKLWTSTQDGELDFQRAERINALLKDPNYGELFKIRRLHTVLWLMDIHIGCYGLTRWILEKKGL